MYKKVIRFFLIQTAAFQKNRTDLQKSLKRQTCSNSQMRSYTALKIKCTLVEDFVTLLNHLILWIMTHYYQNLNSVEFEVRLTAV
jgi:hypothetical protein